MISIISGIYATAGAFGMIYLIYSPRQVRNLRCRIQLYLTSYYFDISEMTFRFAQQTTIYPGYEKTYDHFASL